MNKLILSLALVSLSGAAYASPGHDHGEGAFAGGSAPATHFELTPQQYQNLQIKTAPVQSLPMQQTADMLAFTELLPERSAAISSHFEGKITDINIQIGQPVSKGQALVTLQPVNVGTQPVTLYAPIDGFVVGLDRGIGEIVQSGDDVMHLGDPSEMLVKGLVYETPIIQDIKVGQRIDFHLDIAPQHHFEGTVQRINRVIDPANRTFSIYALIDTPEGDLLPGLQGLMEVFTGDNAPVIAIPKRAVLGEIGANFVYVIEDREVRKKDVTIGAASGYHLEITEGLEEGEHVVIQGNYQLQYVTVRAEHHHDDEDGEDHHDDDDDDSGDSSENYDAPVNAE
jgi:multidrug efflux pump subunit AcrA (membrane-fusion protein)